MIEPVIASIVEERCSGCRVCNDLCPFNAIEYRTADEVSYINAALCKGCGTCVAACPAQAIDGAHFTNEQISAEIVGLLRDVVAQNGDQPAPKPETTTA